MTNEEAKGRLESFIDTFNICKEHDNALVAVSISKEDIQAFTQAIKALETVSCIKEKCAYCPHCENCDVDDETLEIKALEQQPCEDVISRDCDKCAYYVNGANDEACDGCFADEYEHPNFKPKAQHYEDCISRQAVDELSKELVHTTRDKADFLCNFWEGLQKLPSVTPKEKTGKWIYTGDYITDGMLKCTSCGYEHDVADRFLYCPNCGARMEENK